MIVTQEEMRVGVPAMSAYKHLVHLSEHPRFMSGVLAVSQAGDEAAHLALDIGGRRVEIDAVLGDTEPGRYVRWDSAQLVEAYWLEPLGDDATNVVAVAQLDERLVHPHGAQPDAELHARLRMDLKGFKRYCEEAEATAEEAESTPQ
ncbi:hypothetical protein AB0J72_07820 [Dactylosporangium sp. NPDC049742]|uniref:hypothetical protein n=1 Tax=Dactylosporangium sp. NPDC049742 TaxID=3154737 RepID=UPI00341C9F4F